MYQAYDFTACQPMARLLAVPYDHVRQWLSDRECLFRQTGFAAFGRVDSFLFTFLQAHSLTLPKPSKVSKEIEYFIFMFESIPQPGRARFQC